MKQQKGITLKEALERMLLLANNKLSLAKEKEKEWDIKHYENDIKIIEGQLSVTQ